MPDELLDIEAVRSYVGPRGTWAVESGERVTRFRKKLHRDDINEFAKSCGVTGTSMKRIEAGELVPREYLRAVIAWNVGRDIEEIWPPLQRKQISALAAPLVA